MSERSSRFPNSADFITVMNVLPRKALETDIFLANYNYGTVRLLLRVLALHATERDITVQKDCILKPR